MSQKSSLPQPGPICLMSADGGQDAYPRDGKVDLDVLQAMIDIMVEGEELPARPQGDIRRYLDDTLLGPAK